ncbi:MAG: PIN domain nuclease [Pseudonocardiales bacterium]|nr:PIN domain nuclease [Pseudonocardiales bacterium]
MISVVVDSSVWINFFAGKLTWQALNLRERIRRAEQICLTDVVLTELRQGTRDGRQLATLERYLAPFEVARLESLNDFRLAAALHRAGHKAGTPIRTITDCLIAAVCIREGLPLLHDDRDFDHFTEVSDLAVLRSPGS